MIRFALKTILVQDKKSLEKIFTDYLIIYVV